jgi:hypothetical protein
MSFLANPSGDFSLNDDWVYGRAVRAIIEEGHFTLAGGNTSANLIAQAFWGALFCLPFGFSFFALRLSTLALGWIGVLVTYGLLREVGTHRILAWVGALLIACNPIYFGMANTFMTDVPFFAVASLSIYAFIRGLKCDRPSAIWAGILFAYISLLIRQNGLIFPFIFGCAYLVKKGVTRLSLPVAILPALLGVGIQHIYQTWLESTQRNSPNFSLQVGYLKELILSGGVGAIARNAIAYSLVALVYLGLFTAPFILPIAARHFQAFSRSQKRAILFAIPILFTLIAVSLAQLGPRFMPFMPFMSKGGNVLFKFGLGPLTLNDTFIRRINLPTIPASLDYCWIALTGVGSFGATLLLCYLLMTLIHILRPTQQENLAQPAWLKVFIVLTILLYFLPFGIAGYVDRYLLILIPLVMLLVSVSSLAVPRADQFDWVSPKLLPILLTSLLFYGGVTVGATHDYLAWNRMRWQALKELTTELRLSPSQIDGGYEFNGWHLYDPRNINAVAFRRDPSNPDRSWWYVDRDDYLIAFGPVKDYVEWRRYPTGRWLPVGPKTIVALQKQTVSPEP